ncbi:dicarboxylate/amino acid:cation symporter [Corynebacterium ciconiae]|uniref:dicarboxylate/amino acid:cation symporter n=1 Tax=Corynebacterium ciconiae TaxID=227319 RepID=UPI00035CA8D2|nr:dicarboxylate/amino acid:cation symporter [Corynebacterium ciconiae]
MTATSSPRWRTFTSFGAQVIYGLIIGMILGFFARQMGEDSWLTGLVSSLGSTYVSLLKLLIPPLVVTAVITSVANLREVTNATRLAGQTILWFALTALASVVTGLIIGAVLRPGAASSVDASSAAEPETVGSWLGFITSLVPENMLGLSVKVSDTADGLSATPNFNVLQLLLLSIAFGIAAVQVGKAAEPVIEFSRSLLALVQKVLWWIIRLAPIGSAALIARAVATYGWETIGSLGAFVLAIYIGLAVVIGGIYPAVLSLHGLSVRTFYRKVWPVTSLGFVTRSSMGVMPVTERTTEQALGVPRSYTSFAVPLGATTNMDGCAAIYPAIAALFVAQFYGVELGVKDYLLIVFVSVIGSAATAGTTGATVMLTLTLSTLGLPLAGVGLLLAVDPIIDMGRTAVNVTGQALVPAVVAKREGILDETTYSDERASTYGEERTDTEVRA